MGEPESLGTDEPLPERIARHDYDRLIMLSDGVFAIAMTLLALELRPPAGWDGTAVALLRGMGRSLFTFGLSFAVTAVFWSSHRRLIARVRRVDGRFVMLNLLLLALVTLAPTVSLMLAQRGARGDAISIYVGYISLIGLVQSATWTYAGFIAGLMDPGVSRRYRAVMTTTTLLGPAVMSGALIYASQTNAPSALPAALVVALAFIFLRRRALAKA